MGFIGQTSPVKPIFIGGCIKKTILNSEKVLNSPLIYTIQR